MPPDRPSAPSGLQRALPVWVRPATTLFLWGALLVLFLWFLTAFKYVVLGFLAAAAIAAALRPAMDFLGGPRVVRAVVLGLTLAALAAGLVTLATTTIAEPLQQELARWPETEKQINAMLQRWTGRLAEEPLTVRSLLQQMGGILTGDNAPDLLSGISRSIAAVLIALAFIFFGPIYLLAERPGRLIEGSARLLPTRHRPAYRGMIHDLQPRLRWWLLGTLISMTVVGVLSGVGYKLVGLEFALALALLAALAEMVPTFGPMAAGLVALIFAATQGTTQVVGVLVVYSIVQTVESNVLIPWVMKKAVHIPPVVTLFTLVLWGKVFGMAGLLLAIPINLTLWTIAERFIMPRHEQQPAPPPGGAKPKGADDG